MRSVYAVALTAALTLIHSEAAAVEEVNLRSRDGSLDVSGRFLSYDGRYFRIDAVFGVLTVDGTQVTCEGARCPDPDGYLTDLRVSGASESGRSLLPALLGAFAESNGLTSLRQVEDDTQLLYVLSDPEIGREVMRVRLSLTTSSEGLADLVAEAADIALANREATAQESIRSIEVGLGDLRSRSQSRVLALDGIVATVAPGHALTSISMEDLNAVLAGEISNWAAFGLADAPIALHLPETATSMGRALADMLDPVGEDRPARRHVNGRALNAAVAADPLALGVMALSDATTSRPLALAGSCGATLSPTPWSIKTEEYPLTAPHFFVTPGRRVAPRTRAFLEFLSSAESQSVIQTSGFVNQSIETRTLPEQGHRLIRAIEASGRDVGAQDLRALVDLLDGATQTTLTFRFEAREATLDAQSRANVEHLARAIVAGETAGQTILLAGFTDARGAGPQNRSLSRQRAEAVRNAILAALPEGSAPQIEVAGMGEVMPIACDQDDWGRTANRRVEVWLRPQ
jgi:phosphate transport system substrate-binding protein